MTEQESAPNIKPCWHDEESIISLVEQHGYSEEDLMACKLCLKAELESQIDHLLEENAEYQGENAALRRLRKELSAEIRELRAALIDAPEPVSVWPPKSDDAGLALWEAMRRWYYRTRRLAQSNDTPEPECGVEQGNPLLDVIREDFAENGVDEDDVLEPKQDTPD